MNHSRNHDWYYRNIRGSLSNYRYQQRYHDHHFHYDEFSRFAPSESKGRFFSPINESGSQRQITHGEGSSGNGIEQSSDVGGHHCRLQSTELTKDLPCSSVVSQQCHLDYIIVGDIRVNLKNHQQDEPATVDPSVTMEHPSHFRSPSQEKTSCENTVGKSLRNNKGSAESERPSSSGRHQHMQPSTDWTATASPNSTRTKSQIVESPDQKKELGLLSSSDTIKHQSPKTKRPRHGQTSTEFLMGQQSSYYSHDQYLPVHAGRKDILSNTIGSQHEPKLPESDRTKGCNSKISRMSPTAMKFDICAIKSGAPMKLKPPQLFLLRSGMVILKNYISQHNQIQIIKVCRDLGLGDGGFYQPCFRDGRKMHMQMMCLGKNWDPETKLYEDRRPIDGAIPPSIPDEFKKLVELAIQSSHAFIKEEHKERNPEKILPGMQPDICIINFYTNSGKLGLHQDKDESKESLKKGYPVVSFSIGDSADFIYADHRCEENAKYVRLDSGDVLIFGGLARHIFHGVPSIIPDSAPPFLTEEANLRPGRLNLTFRQY